MPYIEALKLQKKLLALRQEDRIDDVLLLLEHPPVLTMGTRAKEENVLFSRDFLLSRGIDVINIDRGGDVTYHGPGQIVGYPILNLKNFERDIHKFVYNIEKIIIDFLWDEYKIKARTDDEYTGVWVGNDKICAIGFTVKKWVTMHGFAFNVNTNLNDFSYIHPCGIIGRGVTSLQKLLGKEVSMDFALDSVVKYFKKIFGVCGDELSLTQLYKLLEEYNG